MPQMSPINWLSLLITFAITLALLNTTVYFSSLPKIQWSLKSYKNTHKNWKW